MKKLLLSGALLFALSSTAQTVVWSEDFESGAGNWNLAVQTGTNDVDANIWEINDLEGGVAPPGCGVASNGNSTLHVACQGTWCMGTGAIYDAGDGGLGFVFATTNIQAELTNPISTVGQTNLTLSFDWIGVGEAGDDYCELFWSNDGGMTWNSINVFSNGATCGGGQGQWANYSTVLPAGCENQADLRIAFNWTNSNNGVGTDPSFAVNDIVLSTPSVVTNDITTDNVSSTTWCEGTSQALTVDFTATGTYNSGNIYSAQLSDGAGSFATPTSIGTLSSSASGSQSISATVPGSTPAGTGYRVRVVASDPATTGSDNGTDIVINPLPTVTLSAFTDVCLQDTMFTLTGGSPSTGTYSGTGVTANVFQPSAAGTGTHTITYSYTDGNGCTNSAQESITVNDCAGINEEQLFTFVLYPNPVDNSFVIEGVDTFEKMEIVDISGRTVLSFNEMKDAYDVSNVPSGTYFVRIITSTTTLTKEVIIE